MDQFLSSAITASLLIIFLFFVALLIGLALHVAGIRPPAWMIDFGFGEITRIGAAIILLVFTYFVVSLFFDFPHIDMFRPSLESSP